MPDQPTPLPSRSQVRKLGSRLRKPDPPTVEDLELLERVRAAYGQVLDQVVRTLLDHGLSSTGRLKTTTTIIEKLRRNPSMGLLTMQDIAGTRIVAEMDRNEQDGMVERLVGLFQNTEVVDRRAKPSSGYRAVHVVAREQGYPVEIQVRTGLQNAWAQVFERLADVLGGRSAMASPQITRTRSLLQDSHARGPLTSSCSCPSESTSLRQHP
jgi:ppGpp synthetase/RelA/SpoT-type nucleotidyltranferase